MISVFEHLCIQFKISNNSFCIRVLYRPPNKSVNQAVSLVDNIVPDIITNNDSILIMGDINVNVINKLNPINECFDVFGLSQIIDDELTHYIGHLATLIGLIFFKHSKQMY